MIKPWDYWWKKIRRYAATTWLPNYSLSIKPPLLPLFMKFLVDITDPCKIETKNNFNCIVILEYNVVICYQNVIAIEINVVTFCDWWKLLNKCCKFNKEHIKPRYIDTIWLKNFRCESVWKIFWNQKGCCVMQIPYTGDYLVFSMSTAMIAHIKEQCSTPTHFSYFLTYLP